VNRRPRVLRALLSARLLVAAIALAVCAGLVWVDGPESAVAASPPAVPGTSCPSFLSDSVWNTPVSGLPVSPQSGQWLASSGAAGGRLLHPDFGSGYGLPFNVVHSNHATTNFKSTTRARAIRPAPGTPRGPIPTDLISRSRAAATPTC
jgi:hypothetical protein